MSFHLLTTEMVEVIHDQVLNPGELSGRALDKSLESALGRVDHRLSYGMIIDAYDLAAAYACVIATGHCFNDGNKRTAHQSMDVCLDINRVEITWSASDVGQIIISAAQGFTDEAELATWLRGKTR